jgi:hypothetical protein
MGDSRDGQRDAHETCRAPDTKMGKGVSSQIADNMRRADRATFSIGVAVLLI